MAKKSDGRMTYPVDINYFIEKCRNVGASDLRIGLKSENPTETGVWFRMHHGMSATSYGEKITVTLTPVQGGTDVHILSECGMPTQLVDYGKNASNVRAIFAYFEKGMPAPGQTVAQPQPAQPQQAAAAPQPQAQTAQPQAVQPHQAQPKVVFCGQCGKANPAGSNFCGGCGSKLN